MIIPAAPPLSSTSALPAIGNSPSAGGPAEGSSGPSPFAQMLQQRQQGGSATGASSNAGSSGPPKTPMAEHAPPPEGKTAATRPATEPATPSTTQAKPDAKPAGKAVSAQRSTLARKGPQVEVAGKEGGSERPAKASAKKTEAASTEAAAGAAPTWPMPTPEAAQALARLADAAGRKRPAETPEGTARIDKMDPTAMAGAQAQPSAVAGDLAGRQAEALPATDAPTAGLPGDTAKPAMPATKAVSAADSLEGNKAAANHPEAPATGSDGLSSPDPSRPKLPAQEARDARSDGPNLQNLERAMAAIANPAQRPAQAGIEERTEALRDVEGKSLRIGATGESTAAQAHALAFSAPPLLQQTPEASVPTLTLNTPVQAPEFREALATQVSLLARDGVQEASLQLNPAELGPISVHIAMDGAQARVDFAVDSAVTRQVIESGLPELASALRDAGLILSGGGVSQQSSQSAQQQQEAFARQGNPQPGGQGRGAPEASASPTPRRSVSMNVGGLDLYA